MFGWLATFVVARRWWIIGAWVVAAGVIIALAPKIGSYTSDSYNLPDSYQSVQAQAVAAQDFPTVAGASGVLAVSATDGSVLSSADQQKITELVTSLNADHIEAVTSISTSPLYLSQNQKVQLVQVVMAGQPGAAGPNAAVAAIRSNTTGFLADTGLVGGLTGNAAISVDETAAFDHAGLVIGVATVLLILLLLGLVFRSVLIALLPIVVIGVVHQMAQAITAFLAEWLHFDVGPDLAPLLIVVMFGVGTDYMVFLFFRHREQIAKGADPASSLLHAVSRVGVVIASAAATVIAAFGALLVASIGQLRTLAPGLMVGVFLMFLAALTLVPAICSLLGLRLFWPTMPKAPDPTRRTRSERIGNAVAKHPAMVLLISVGVLAALGLGTLNYKITYNQLAELPASTPSTVAFNTVASAFPPGTLGPTEIFITAPTALSAAEVSALQTKLSTTTGVATVVPAQYADANKAAMIQLLLSDNPYSNAAIADLAGPIRSAVAGSVPGATIVAGGVTSSLADVKVALHIDTLRILPLALLIVAVILALLLRAILGPIYLLIGGLLTYAATLGVIVLIFINGFNFVGLDFSLPITAYIFVIAVGTDYNILMASRLKEQFLAGDSPREAARTAVVHGSPAVGRRASSWPPPSPRCSSPGSSCSRRSAWPWPSGCCWRPTSSPPASCPPWPR